MRTVKIGCPGFIFLNDFEADFEGTLRKIADLGFDGVEITGFFGRPPEEIGNACRAAGLEPFGTFINLDEVLGKTPKDYNEVFRRLYGLMGTRGSCLREKLEGLKPLGSTFLGLTFPPGEPDEAWLKDISRVVTAAIAAGYRIYYHNHDHEFRHINAGVSRMDRILAGSPAEMELEPDLGWMAIGGCDPMKFLKKHASRIPVVHLKDYYRPGDDSLSPQMPFRFVPTGYGVLNWAEILSYCEEVIQPEWYVTDHDSAYDGDICEELKMSLDYVRAQLRYIHLK